MSRSLTAAVIAAMQSASVKPIILLQAQFASGTIYVWSGIGTLSWNGQSWVGLGELGKISAIQETTSGQAKGVTVSLSGIPSSIVTSVLTEVRPQYPASIWIGYLDASGNVIANPEQRFAGWLDVVRITEGGDTSTVQVNIESKLIDLNRARERRWTHQDQQIDYPGDNGFIYVNGIQELQVIWGQSGTAINNLPTAASIGGSSTSQSSGTSNPSAPPPSGGRPVRVYNRN